MQTAMHDKAKTHVQTDISINRQDTKPNIHFESYEICNVTIITSHCILSMLLYYREKQKRSK